MQARGGRPGGNILDLVALFEGCSIRDAAVRLQSSRDILPQRTVVPSAEMPPEPNTPLRFTLQHVDRAPVPFRARPEARHNPYVWYRHVWWPRISARIVIPIHNERGELMAYVGRAPDDAIPKYRFPKGFRKSLVLFNLHRARVSEARDVNVVEGFFDVFAVHQAGYPAVVALMGSTLSTSQADLLASNFDRAVLMLDADDAGRHGLAMIIRVLESRMRLATIVLEESKQPDQMAPEEIRLFVDLSTAI